MVVKKYLVRDMPEALTRIKKDLGPEAVIISSYRVPGPGLKGLFVKRLEVTAALDERPEEKYFGRVNALPKTAGGKGAKRPVPGSRLSAPPRVAGRPSTHAGTLPGVRPPVSLRQDWRSHLNSLQVGDNLVQALLDGADYAPATGGEERWRPGLEQRLAGWCERYCSTAADSRVVVLVGPAGTGKTTTLVKLAARDVLYRQEKVAIVTLNYAPQPGGTEFLRHWARLLDVPFAVVTEPAELERLLSGWGGVSRFYLDTPSDPFFRAGRLLELTGFLSRIQGAQTLLVLSATTRDADVLRAVAHSRRLAVSGAVLTKLDEVSSLGPVLNLLPALGLSLQYLGVGREIPEDLHPAGGALLTSLLLGGAGRDGDSALLAVK